MSVYYKKDIDNLKKIINNYEIHDSLITYWKYDDERRRFLVQTFNSIFEKGYLFVFSDVDSIIYNKGNEVGERKTIVSFSVDEFNDSCTQRETFVKQDDEKMTFCFEMLSGDELYITAQNISLEGFQVA